MNASGERSMVASMLRGMVSARSAMGGVALPATRFFKPTRKLFMLLARLDRGGALTFIDCGCGTGATTRELRAEGFDVKGIDLLRREGQGIDVSVCDAVLYPFSATVWPLICRPSHDGWAREVLDQARIAGAHVLYAGLPKNLKYDMGRVQYSKHWREVGSEGETLYLYAPHGGSKR